MRLISSGLPDGIRRVLAPWACGALERVRVPGLKTPRAMSTSGELCENRVLAAWMAPKRR